MQNEALARIKERKNKRIKRNVIKVTTGLTALTISCSLMANYCQKKAKDIIFDFNTSYSSMLEKKNNINFKDINKYYVLELYHTRLDRSMLYIAERFIYTSGDSKYTNVINNCHIAYDENENDNYEFINVTPLLYYLEKYNFIKNEYTYEDILYLDSIITAHYEFEDTSNLKQSLEEEKDTLVKKRTIR